MDIAGTWICIYKIEVSDSIQYGHIAYLKYPRVTGNSFIHEQVDLIILRAMGRSFDC